MILVVELTEHHDALGALAAGKEMEVEQYHLALQVGEAANLTLAVLHGEVDAAVYAHLAGVNLLLCTLVLYDADILHALDGDVVQVLATLGARIVGIPAGSHGSKHSYIVLVVAGIEDERIHVAQLDGLEEGIVGRSLHRLLEDVVHLDVLLVAIEHAGHDDIHRVDAHVRTLGDGVDVVLQNHLLNRKLLDLAAVLRTLHLIFIAHLRIGSLHLDGLRRVDAEVDALVGDAEAVEFRGDGIHGVFVEGERTVFSQLHGVNLHRSVQAQILQIEHRVCGLGNVTVDMKFLVVTRRKSQRSYHDHCG